MTVMDRDSCAHLGILSPEKIAELYAATGIPKAPDVRRCRDEMSELPVELTRENPHSDGGAVAAAGLATACLIAGFFFT